jgi:hypothetical protein
LDVILSGKVRSEKINVRLLILSTSHYFKKFL